MRPAPIILSLAILACAGGAATAGTEKIRHGRDVIAARPIGKPVSCIPLRSIRETRVRDDRTIDFYMNGRNRVYRNTLPHQCPSLGFEERFLYKTSLSQLCSTDIITVLTGGPGLSRGASCGLGEFQPVEIAKK